MKINILGVSVDGISLRRVIDQIVSWTTQSGQHYIATVNPEFIVAAQKNQQFKDVLNRADIAVCDGFGLQLASGMKLQRVTGVDVCQKLLENTAADVSLFLLGGTEGSGQKVVEKYPRAHIVGAESGGKINADWEFEDNDVIIEKIMASGATILLVALGQVKQEMWIAKNLTKVPNVKVAIGVGGTFDYLSGTVKRAPGWIRKMGLEWLFRLVRQPRRIGRIFNAVVKFNWLLFTSKISPKS